MRSLWLSQASAFCHQLVIAILVWVLVNQTLPGLDHSAVAYRVLLMSSLRFWGKYINSLSCGVESEDLLFVEKL